MKVAHVFSLLLLLSIPLLGIADWKVDQNHSSLTYLSTKMSGANTLFENNRFTSFSGTVKRSGEALLTIDLNSVVTGVGIRDERVKEHVFDVRNHPQAIVKLSVGELEKADYGVGQVRSVEASLTMRGVTRQVKGEVSVTRTGEDLLVQTQSPILIDAKDYGMLDGFETLRNLVQLSGIPMTIPVSFKLQFVPDR